MERSSPLVNNAAISLLYRLSFATEDSEPGRRGRIRCRSVPHGENAPDHILVDGEAEGPGDPWRPPGGVPLFHVDDCGTDQSNRAYEERTHASNDTIREAEIGRTPPGAIEDQEFSAPHGASSHRTESVASSRSTRLRCHRNSTVLATRRSFRSGGAHLLAVVAKR